ncbi:MAG: D-alanyl-D-alanine carboxypeptidase/D-alanyl-D-alanine-endopeptidase [bacterium]
MLNKFFFTAFILLSFCVNYAQTDTTRYPKINPTNLLPDLRNQLDDTFNDPNFSNAFWGVYIKSLKTGEVIYKRNSDKLFVPASDVKLFTSAAALLLLGSNYTYKTLVFTDGNVVKDTLFGNIIIRGSGDPTLSLKYPPQKSRDIFEAWADSLLLKGIKCIKGNIYGDDNLFDDLGYGSEWPWETENFWYASPSGGLSFNENIIELNISPSATNMPAEIKTIPHTDYVNIVNKIITTADKKTSINFMKDKSTELVLLSGYINSNDEMQKIFIPVGDPTRYFLTVLNETLERKGIALDGYTADLDTEEFEIIPDNLVTLFSYKSIKLGSMIKELNKNSNNFFAEQIFKTIGLELFNQGTIENGVKACNQIFDLMGIFSDNLQIVDGSGLSRLNFITPKQIVNLLSYMYKSDGFETFYGSLPIAGIDGTLADRMLKTKAENNVRAKPGFLNGVRTLSGYLRTADDEPIVFSMIANNFLVPANLINYVFDSVCIRLANFTRN